MSPLRIRQIKIYKLAIPMRLRFEHAAAAREVADPIIVQLSPASPYAHHAGFGETLARTYVTGESTTSVVDDLVNLFTPRLRGFTPESYVEALEFIEALPTKISGRIVTAARAAMEIALLDLAGRVFRRRLADVAGWMGLGGFGPPGVSGRVRYAGIVVGSTERKLKRFLKLQRWYGLRDFKLKVGVANWQERLAWAHDALRGGLDRRRVTLRVDANAHWSLADAHDALSLLEENGVSLLEQPLSETADEDLPWLAEQAGCDLGVDESLLTTEDAERLIRAGGVRVFNIRLAKNGGLMPSLRLAGMVLAAGLDVQFGCLVGQTSILTAAELGFLEACPKVRFLEGAFGRRLLREDIARPSLQFGYGGRLRSRPGFGLGVEVNTRALERLTLEPPRLQNL